MRLAVCDYEVVPANPSGSCVRHLVEELATSHDVVVFSLAFDRPPGCADVRWRRVRVPRRPLALLFVAYQLWGTGIRTAQAQNELEDDFAGRGGEFHSRGGLGPGRGSQRAQKDEAGGSTAGQGRNQPITPS